MQNKKLAKKITRQSTQKYLDIYEIRDDAVVLNDGTLRAVLLVSSINFALKSEDEQNAVISSYVSFINSFEFPIQIVVQSRKLNIDNYIERLKSMEKEQTNELLRMQTIEYRQYIQELVSLGQIMSKKFYLTVPYDPLSNKQKGFFSRLSESLRPAAAVTLDRKRFVSRKKDLMQRVSLIRQGLNSMGLNSVMLNTQNLIELYYNSYNPVVSQNQKLVETSKIQVD
ncbi:MAG: hypothetical protein HY453_00745 [Parcubacteria group bacterium]|nr:hypothetical protein [Parcubacteria group bacterium]